MLIARVLCVLLVLLVGLSALAKPAARKPAPAPAKSVAKPALPPPVPAPEPPVAVGVGGGIGLQGEYFDNPDFSAFKGTRLDPSLTFAWSKTQPPLPAMAADSFSVRWTGFVQARTAGTYTFSLQTTGAVRLWVGERLVLDRWAPHPLADESGTAELPAFSLVPIRLLTVQGTGELPFALRWSGPGVGLEALPTAALYPPSFGGWRLIYMDSATLPTAGLWLTTLDGKPQRVQPGGDGEPALSSDGKRLVFTSGRFAAWTDPKVTLKNTELFLYDLTRKTTLRLTHSGTQEREPAFSPDGKKLAYAASDGTNWELWTMNADGRRATQHTHNTEEDGAPVFTPDGAALLFHSRRAEGWNLYRIELESGAETQLTTLGGRMPAMSPSGEQVVFVSERDGTPELYTMKLDGSAQTRLTTNSLQETHPTFTPDGRGIVVAGRDGAGKTDVYLLPGGGGQLYRLTALGRCHYPVLTTIPQEGPAPSVVYWLSAARTASITTDDGGRVRCWADLAGRRDALQENAQYRPEFRTSGINGQPALYFDGGDDHLVIPDLSAGWTGGGGTLLILFAPDNDDAYTVWHQQNASDSEWWRYNGNGASYLSPLRTYRTESQPAVMPTAGPTLITVVSGEEYKVYINGQEQTNQPGAFIAPNGTLLGTGGHAGPLRGWIAEVILCNTVLGEADRQALEATVRAKYGL